MVTLKNDFDPIGCTVLVRSQLAGAFTWHQFKVHAVTGADKNIPNPDGPTIHMEIAEKNRGGLQQFISLPLSAFDQRVLSLDATDQFWEMGKTIAA